MHMQPHCTKEGAPTSPFAAFGGGGWGVEGRHTVDEAEVDGGGGDGDDKHTRIFSTGRV